jgi:hypothetical protein
MPASKKKPARKGKAAKKKRLPKPKQRMAKRKPGTDFEKGIEHFAEEIEWHGKRLERRGKKWEKRAKSWWYTTFGPVGPLIHSLVGIAVIGIVALLINLFNAVLVSTFVSGLALFMMDSIPIFLVIFLFFNYIKYFYYINPKSRPVLRPFEAAAGVTVMFWLFGWVLLLAHQSAEIGFFQRAANWIFPNLWNIFIIILVIAYLGAIMVHSEKRIIGKGGKE